MALPVLLPRIEGRPLVAFPMCLPNVSRDIFAPCRAIVVFVDLGRETATPDNLFRDVFKLTPAEVKLAEKTTCGDDLTTAADELGVALETVRCQLKSIFAKTETNRQSQLIALLNKIAGVRCKGK